MSELKGLGVWHPNSETRSSINVDPPPLTTHCTVTRVLPHTSIMPTPYEKQRMENIKRNRELLLAQGLDGLKNFVEKKDVAPPAKSRKRKSPPPPDMKEENGSGAKAVKTRATQDITNTSGVRRSARNSGKTVDYKSEVVRTLPEVISTAAKIAMNSEKRAASERRHNPCVFFFQLVPGQSLMQCRNVENIMAPSLELRLANGGRPGTFLPNLL